MENQQDKTKEKALLSKSGALQRKTVKSSVLAGKLRENLLRRKQKLEQK